MKNYTKGLKAIVCIAIFCCPVLTSFVNPEDTTQSKPFKVRTIVIDAGHGGKDPGAHGSYSVEKAVALSIAKKLRDAINESMPSIKVIMTRDDNTFIELNRRSEIANERTILTCLYLSTAIHRPKAPQASRISKKA